MVISSIEKEPEKELKKSLHYINHEIRCGKRLSSQTGDVTLGRKDTASLDKQYRKNGKDHTTPTRNVCIREKEGKRLKANFCTHQVLETRPKAQE